MFTLLLLLLKRRGRQEREALEHHFGAKKSEEEKVSKLDPMAGYKPSKKARAAALKAFNQKFPQLGHASWAGYSQAQMTSPVAQQANYGRMQMQNAEQVSPQPKQEEGEIQQATSKPQEEWTNSTSEVQTNAEGLLDEAPWTTEQVWEWGRNQGWDDGQIAAYEQIYDQSVRNPESIDATQEPEVSQQESDENVALELSTETEATEETQGIDAPTKEDEELKKGDIRDQGIMKAMSGTNQGESGWYLDGEGNPSRWDIDEAGQWHRTG